MLCLSLTSPDRPTVPFLAPCGEREATGREGRGSSLAKKSSSPRAPAPSLKGLKKWQFFNKENRKRSLGRCQEIVITDVLYLRTKNIFSINIFLFKHFSLLGFYFFKFIFYLFFWWDWIFPIG